MNSHILKITLFIFLFWVSVASAWPGQNGAGKEAMRLGDECVRLGEWESALKYFEEAGALDAGDAEIRLRLAQTYYQLGRYRKALDLFDQLKGEHLKFRIEKYVRQASDKIHASWSELQSIENTQESQENEHRLIELHSTVIEFMSKEPPVYVSMLAPHLEYLLKHNASNEALLRFSAETYFWSSDPLNASKYYEMLLKLQPKNQEILRRAADASVASTDFERAHIFYRKLLRQQILEKKPIDKTLAMIRAMPLPLGKIALWIDAQEFEKAHNALKRRLLFSPGDTGALIFLAMVYEEAGIEWQAERLYRRLIKDCPELAESHFYYGRFLLQKKKKFEEAAEELEIYQDKTRRYLGERSASSQKKKILKNLADSSKFLAYIYADILKNPGRAINRLGEAIRIGGEDQETLYGLGVLYVQDHKRMMAVQTLKKAIELKPDSDLAQKSRDLIDEIRKYPDYGGPYASPYD